MFIFFKMTVTRYVYKYYQNKICFCFCPEPSMCVPKPGDLAVLFVRIVDFRWTVLWLWAWFKNTIAACFLLGLLSLLLSVIILAKVYCCGGIWCCANQLAWTRCGKFPVNGEQNSSCEIASTTTNSWSSRWPSLKRAGEVGTNGFGCSSCSAASWQSVLPVTTMIALGT